MSDGVILCANCGEFVNELPCKDCIINVLREEIEALNGKLARAKYDHPCECRGMYICPYHPPEYMSVR